MEVGGKDTTTRLGILNLTGGNSNIGHNFIKILDNNIGWETHKMDHESINQNIEDELPLKLDHDVDLWNKLKWF